MHRIAFLRIVSKEYAYLVKAAFKNGAEFPKEVVHDVIARALETEAYKNLDPKKGSIRGWLYVSIRYRCLNLFDRKVLETAYVSQLELPSFPASEQEQEPSWLLDEETPERMELAVDVHKAVESLPFLPRQVALYVYMGNDTYEDVAERLRLPINTVREAGRICREKLRGALREYSSETVGKLLEKTG